MNEIDEILGRQDGVIARSQALAAGDRSHDIRRRLRRRDWVTVHPGVYVNHTGQLTWRQRAWAAVLLCEPAALSGRSALRAHEGPGRRDYDDTSPIEVVIDHGRKPPATRGIRVRASRRFQESVQLDLSPPRQRYDDAIVELADRAADDVSAIAVLADACGARRTTAARLQHQLTSMSRVRRRKWLAAVLTDIAEGTCSVLEHAYLTRVERAHGLPRGLRQVQEQDDQGRRVYRDVVYGGTRPRWRQYVELDGRLGHDTTTDRARDLERDLNAAIDHTGTVRLGYGQIMGRPCSTAAKLARLFRDQGWDGEPTRCPECAEGAELPRSAASGATR